MAKLVTLKEDFDQPESCWFRYMQSQKKNHGIDSRHSANYDKSLSTTVLELR